MTATSDNGAGLRDRGGALVTGGARGLGLEIARKLEVNANGTINGTVAALEPMRTAGHGHIINIISMAGLVPAPGFALYTASKRTPMLFDKLEDPDAAASFSGTMLRPEEVAVEVIGLLDNPVPVLAMPKWRGAMLRTFSLMPKLFLRFAPRVIANAKRRQRRFARKVRAGKV